MGIVVVAFIVAAWLFRPRLEPPTEAEPPAAPTETAVEEAQPPVPSYARPHRDFAKRRGAPRQSEVVTNTPELPLEELYGVRVCGMRMSMGNHYVDLRYKVLDSAKMARLNDGKTPCYLVDFASGTKLLMRKPPAEGAFPPMGNRLLAGRTYSALIANPNQTVKSGSTVVFKVGGAWPTNLVVQ